MRYERPLRRFPPSSEIGGSRPSMRFLSYNLRNAGIRKEAVWNNWSQRRDAVVDLITKEDPDVLALQEDSSKQLEYIRGALKESHGVYLDPAFYDAVCSRTKVAWRKQIDPSTSITFRQWSSISYPTNSACAMPRSCKAVKMEHSRAGRKARRRTELITSGCWTI